MFMSSPQSVGGYYLNKQRRMTKKQVVLYSILAICLIGSFIFVYNNHAFYERPIAKVVETNVEDSTEVVDRYDNEDRVFTQQMKAKIKNGAEKGRLIYLTNKYSLSGAYDQEYEVGNELFIGIDEGEGQDAYLTGAIQDVKRDTYLLPVVWIFIFTLLLIGKRQGFYSVISLVVNALLLSYALDIYVKYDNVSLLLICGVTVILFTVISLLLVSGFNEKTYAAIIATLLGTFVSLLIAYLVLWITNENGLRYEAMDFLTRPYQVVFLAGLFIGSLGAVMDVAISIAASIFEMHEEDPRISTKALRKSGMDIGKDIMGTMTSILFFVYISGSIPMLILYLKNGSPLNFTLSLNLSLELARALAGGIGIVLAIPIGVYVSILFVHRKRAKV